MHNIFMKKILSTISIFLIIILFLIIFINSFYVVASESMIELDLLNKSEYKASEILY